jgi:hypothetical protein
MNSSRRRFGGKYLVGLTLGLALSSLAFVSPVEAGFSLEQLIKFYHGASKIINPCKDILSEGISGGAAVPAIRKTFEGVASKRWKDNFDVALFRRMEADFKTSEKLQLVSKETPEGELAYLSALIERTTGMQITLADTFLNDPDHARALQMVCKDFNFSKPLSRYEIHQFVERAFVATGKLDVVFKDFKGEAGSDTAKKLHIIMKEHLWKEMAKQGIVKHYTDLGIRIFTKEEVEKMVETEIRDEAKAEVEAAWVQSGKVLSESEKLSEIKAVYDVKYKLKFDARFGELKGSMLMEGTKKRWTRIFHSQGVQAALAVPTWFTAWLHLHPGLLPKYEFIRFDEVVLQDCLERGLHLCFEPLEAGVRKGLYKQHVYDIFRNRFAWWAGVFTVGFAVGELYGIEPQKIHDWIIENGKLGMEEIDRLIVENGGVLPAEYDLPPIQF